MGIKKDGAFSNKAAVLLFWLILDITHYVPNLTPEYAAKSINSVGADTFVPL